MSLPAYLFLFDENGMQVQGDCMMPGREGAIEIMNSSYGIKQAVDSHTGNMTGTRQHSPVTVHKQLDKVSPYLAVAPARADGCKKPLSNIMKLLKREQKGRSTPLRLIAW